LAKIEVMQEAVAFGWLRQIDPRSPVTRSEEGIEICFLIGMADEAIYLLVHEGDEDLAAGLSENGLDDREGSPRPPEGINEGECRRQPAVPVRVGTMKFRECLLKCLPAFGLHNEVLGERHRLHELAEKLGAVRLLLDEYTKMTWPFMRAP
jgi:hypothetical protein